MPENNIRVWEISPGRGAVEFQHPDITSLDAFARQLPQGLYSTFRTYARGTRVLGLRSHLERLYRPVGGGQIKPLIPEELLRNSLAGVMRDYPDEARVRVIMTGNGRVYIALERLKPLLKEIYTHGVKVITTDVQRLAPRQKTTAFISASEATRNLIAGSDIFEALLVRDGSILEGMTSNFFFVKDGKLGTARNDILLGVTRRIVLRVARRSGIDIVYRSLKQEQVPVLDEAFITSSSRGIVPVIQIDEVTVGEGRSGTLTWLLSNAYKAYVLRHAEVI